MIVVAVKDVFFASKMTEIANKMDKKIKFVFTDKELEDAAKGSELIIADLNQFSLSSIRNAKKHAAVVGYLEKRQKKRKEDAESVCDAVVTKEEVINKMPEILGKL